MIHVAIIIACVLLYVSWCYAIVYRDDRDEAKRTIRKLQRELADLRACTLAWLKAKAIELQAWEMLLARASASRRLEAGRINLN